MTLDSAPRAIECRLGEPKNTPTLHKPNLARAFSHPRSPGHVNQYSQGRLRSEPRAGPPGREDFAEATLTRCYGETLLRHTFPSAVLDYGDMKTGS
ncbi:hypothetical protein VTO73DRAFT_10300 [Trametes versicolor]